MNKQITVHAVGVYEYLIGVTEDDDVVEFRIRATSGVPERLGHRASEDRVVAATAELLTERQLAVDLAPVLDLDDVEAGYNDYLAELAERLR